MVLKNIGLQAVSANELVADPVNWGLIGQSVANTFWERIGGDLQQAERAEASE